MRIGYARVSTIEQNIDMQIQSLQQFGCEKIFVERKSGRNYKDRQDFMKMLSMLREGDEVVCWKIDRLGRNARDIWEISTNFKEKGVSIISITESINTATAVGEMFCKMAGLFAEMEIANHSERTKAGQAAARKRGSKIGRPHGISKKYLRRYRMISVLLSNGVSAMEIAKEINISTATVYRYIRKINMENQLVNRC